MCIADLYLGMFVITWPNRGVCVMQVNVLKLINTEGDGNVVCAMTGQLAGAIYGRGFTSQWSILTIYTRDC